MSARMWVYEALDALALRRFDAVVAVSRGVAARLRRRIAGSALEVIHNGIRLPEADGSVGRGSAAGSGAPAAPKTIGCLGRLAPVKGLEYLLDAMPAVAAGRDCRLLIAGEGPLRGALEKRAGSLGIAERLRFVGYVDDVDGFLSGIDLLVMPSLSEGLPMALLEAASRGVPIVASNVGGIPELIHDGINGLLVPPADPGALAGSIARVLDDPGLAARLSAAGRQTVLSGFTAEAMAGCYERLYARLTAGS